MRCQPPGPAEQDLAQHPVDLLLRWERFGAVWRVIARTPGQVTVSLCRCDGGEEVQRLTSSDPTLLAFIGNRAGSDG